MSGTLSVVATPIGNLEDITLRALRTFRECDYVLCEDTRVTGKLLSHHGIKAQLKRYDAHASEKVHEQVLADLEEGKHIALCSDAGTPGISDPGVFLVARAREAGARTEAIPGPSALTAALSLAGIAGNQCTFLGFAPHKKGRQTFFRALPDVPQPAVFFESTHRVMKALDALVAEHPGSRITVARELTKIHEEIVVGTPSQVREHFLMTPIKQKGEFVIMFEGEAVR
ncbi:16S rRNA (cytidine(1402)-2'-O)-methyltransferase [Patescibacteria group bacterium]|nr:16S rRNA (cytidine(1402)-2'-O)-methyltransferase [Patescibacteria group bacterium]